MLDSLDRDGWFSIERALETHEDIVAAAEHVART